MKLTYKAFLNTWKSYRQCCGAGAALFGRSREKTGGSGSSYTAQASVLKRCLKQCCGAGAGEAEIIWDLEPEPK